MTSSPAQATPSQNVTVKEAKQLVRRYMEANRWGEAFDTGLRILNASPSHDDVWNDLQRCAPNVPAAFLNQHHLQMLLHILNGAPSKPGIAALLALQLLAVKHAAFSACMQLSVRQGILEDIDPEGLRPLFKEPLFHLLLQRYIVPNIGFELMMTGLRCQLLARAEEEQLKPFQAVLFSLAMQCDANGYCYFHSQEERHAVERLREKLSKQYERNSFLLLACYEPPLKMPEVIQAAAAQDEQLQGLVKTTIIEPQDEYRLAQSIACVGDIENEVSISVRQQYEEHPYPRWLSLPDIPEETPVALMKRLFPTFDASVLRVGEEPHVLIAGCGTGRQALEAARRFRKGEVTAVDLSRASLGYALRKTLQTDVSNILYLQADILQLGLLEQQFDLIESCGVLHHMQDPMAGWQVLVDALKPGGLIKIALYSAKAREGITQCRQHISEMGFGDSENDISALRLELMTQQGAVTQYPFIQAFDFFSMPECRDLLFHRQEHCFSLPQIAQAIDTLGLTFIGFDVPSSALIELYRARFPQDENWNNLENWHQLEQEHPALFFGMYQFWCYKPRR